MALNGSSAATLDAIAAILTGGPDAVPTVADGSSCALPPTGHGAGKPVTFVIKADGKRFLLDAPQRRVPPTPVVLGRLREAVGEANVRMVPAPPKRRERAGRPGGEPWRRSSDGDE